MNTMEQLSTNLKPINSWIESFSRNKESISKTKFNQRVRSSASDIVQKYDTTLKKSLAPRFTIYREIAPIETSSELIGPPFRRLRLSPQVGPKHLPQDNLLLSQPTFGSGQESDTQKGKAVPKIYEEADCDQEA